MNTPRQPQYRSTRVVDDAPVTSFTRIIAIAPAAGGFDGWGPSRWN